MLTIPTGKVLGPADLCLYVRDETGNASNPYYISYTILKKVENGQLTPVTTPRSDPATNNLGLFYVNMAMPTSWADGDYQLLWHIQQYQGAVEGTVTEDFSVMDIRPETGSLEAPSILMAKRLNVKPSVVNAIVTVRELLSDTNPDRNYHFRPPVSAKVVAGYSTRVGYIWEDTTILRLLGMSVAQINTGSVKNLFNYTVETIPPDWGQAAALGAASKCLNAESCRWVADEFGYSLNGVSLTLEKGAKYQGLAQQYNQEFWQWIPLLTANRPASLGVRQSRFLR